MDSVLQASLTALKGVGQRLAEKFNKLNLYQLSDLLYHFPIRYQDRTKINKIGESTPSQEVQIFAKIDFSEITFGRKRMLLIYVNDGTGTLCLRFFNFSVALKNQLSQGRYVLLFGQLHQGKQYLEILHPEFKISGDQMPKLGKSLTPIYALTEGVSQNLMRNCVAQVLERFEALPEVELLTSQLIKKNYLMGFKEAILALHNPNPKDVLMGEISRNHPARKRLVIEEILAHQIKQKEQSKKLFSKLANPFRMKQDIVDKFYNQLPFKPTNAQLRVIKEIENDLQTEQAMLRLLQGDVGAGKTLVAAVASLIVIANNFQVALMAPTEILAEQHYESLKQELEAFKIQCALLKGKLKRSEKQEILKKLKNGEIQFIVGTHALIQDDVTFLKLGLAIIDEQHRFGVLQRKALIDKGQYQGRVAHQLIMTATPIPRTLAMTAYSDLKLSIIDELPLGRKPVITIALAQSRRTEILQKLKNHCATGRQAYWVCTLIEESEFLQNQTAEGTYELLVQSLPELKISLIHGRMKSKQKDKIMENFKRGINHILVSTTVIEVGVNIPNATLMVIEDANRLGLAQLHQLRGRVGRSDLQSYCVLLYKSPLSKLGKQRLGIMRETTDGFIIAEKDLLIRGPGEYLGIRQTGQLVFKVANLEIDSALIEYCEQYKDSMMAQPKVKRDALVNRWITIREELVNI